MDIVTQVKALLQLDNNPTLIFTPLHGPVERCPIVGEKYRSKYDVLEVVAVGENQRLTLRVVEADGKPFEL